MTAAEAIRRFEKINVDSIVQAAIENTAPEFIKLNEQQWQEGKTNTGEYIAPNPYSKPYAKIRQKEGLQTSVIDLYRRGNLYKGYDKLKVDSGAVVMQSNVEYEKYVSGRYKNIYGLNPESLKIYVPGVLQENVREQITAETGFQYK